MYVECIRAMEEYVPLEGRSMGQSNLGSKSGNNPNKNNKAETGGRRPPQPISASHKGDGRTNGGV